MNWPDTNGNLWLFGGYNYSMGYLNDLWSYNTTSQDWTWVSGNDTANQGGTYGPLGQFSTSYDPGARQSSVTWTDNQGNLWLLGGYGYVPGNEGYLNDLWSFNPTNDQWALMSGSSSVNQSGVYGALYSPSATNIPGARQSSISWKDENGNLWLFGGYGIDSTGNYGYLNDLWEFQPTIATTTLLTSSSNPSTYGVSVTFTATVSPTTGSTTPTGSVQFSVNGSPVGSAVTLGSGQATYTTSTLAVGTQAISAVYTPTGVYTGSTSNTVNQ
jgi:N-acetylneuraminic acid mutarotase